MTYRNKLILKYAAIALGVIVAVVLAVLLIGFVYLGRYVVYTEDGAHFSFYSAEAEGDAAAEHTAPDSIQLVTGEPILVNEVYGDGQGGPEADQVQGVFVDYATLYNGSTLNRIEVGAEGSNTLMLEMRTADRTLISSEEVTKLIDRAKGQDTWMIAAVSCLSDSSYAQANIDLALRISGGALWMSPGGSYWLDPAQEEVIDYLAETIRQLSVMGFDEVVLEDFYFPYSDSIQYDYNGRSGAEITMDAYYALSAATMDYCKLGLLIDDPDSGHQAFDAAERIYVRFDDGGAVKEYVDSHAEQYVVFITDSHDTRFDGYGKIWASGEYTVDSAAPVVTPRTDEKEE